MQLLTKIEASQKLKLSISKIEKMMAGNEIPYNKIGKKVLFNEAKLEKWLEKSEVKELQ